MASPLDPLPHLPVMPLNESLRFPARIELPPAVVLAAPQFKQGIRGPDMEKIPLTSRTSRVRRNGKPVERRGLFCERPSP